MSLTPEDVRVIARLARLDTDEAAIPAYVDHLNRILDFVSQLNAVNTHGVEPMAHPQDVVQRLRADAVTEADQREKFQRIAPAVADGLYLVPKVIE